MRLTALAAVTVALSFASAETESDAFRSLVEIVQTYARGDPSEAAAMISQWTDHDLAIAKGPDLAVARLKLGRLLWRLREPESAREALEEAIRRARGRRRDAYWDYLTMNAEGLQDRLQALRNEAVER